MTFVGCYVNNENVIFSKNFYRHREPILYTCRDSNSLPLTANETIRCINGSLTEQPICQPSRIEFNTFFFKFNLKS